LKPSSCGVAAHTKKIELDTELFYVKENETRAFSKPAFHCPSLLPPEIDAIKETKMTIKEFTVLFEDLQQGKKPDWLAKIELQPVETKLARDCDELASPRFLSENAGMFALVPKLSFESDAEVELLDEIDPSPQIIVHLLREYHRWFANLKAKWSQTFLDVEASHALVVKDLLSLQRVSSGLKQVLGTPDPADFLENRSVLKDLRLLTDDVKLLSEANQTVKSQWRLFCEVNKTFVRPSSKLLKKRKFKLFQQHRSFNI